MRDHDREYGISVSCAYQLIQWLLFSWLTIIFQPQTWLLFTILSEPTVREPHMSLACCWYAWYWLLTAGRVCGPCAVLRLAVDITTQWQINWHTVSDRPAPHTLYMMRCQFSSVIVIHWQHKCCVAWETMSPSYVSWAAAGAPAPMP